MTLKREKKQGTERAASKYVATKLTDKTGGGDSSAPPRLLANEQLPRSNNRVTHNPPGTAYQALRVVVANEQLASTKVHCTATPAHGAISAVAHKGATLCST